MIGNRIRPLTCRQLDSEQVGARPFETASRDEEDMRITCRWPNQMQLTNLKIRPGLVLSALTDDSLLLSLRSASLEDVVK